MPSSRTIHERILGLAQNHLSALERPALGDVAREVEEIGTTLEWLEDSCVSETREINQIRLGVHASEGAIQLGMASKALNTAVEQIQNPSAASRKMVEVDYRIAERCLLAALAPLSQLPDDAFDHPVDPEHRAKPHSNDKFSPRPEATRGQPNCNYVVLHNIATYHREHERYYAREMTQDALEIYRAANTLHTIAQAWQRAATGLFTGKVDFSLPEYRAAGCVDLNALEAISTIGVLFMEGESEPAELRALKGEMKSRASALGQAAYWLREKADAAWIRERSALTRERIELAEARFHTICTNWCVSREMQLASRLLDLALTLIHRVDFRPPSIRADRERFATELVNAGWVLTMAAQLHAQAGASLAGNDWNWQSYLDGLKALIG